MKAVNSLDKETLIQELKMMIRITQLETRAEACYQMGLIGGFFHAYTGQEAIATSLVRAAGVENFWVATYRCHAIALLLGVSPKEIMAELFGKASGNAKGRGGSMHLYTDRLLGGFGIVGGQIPVAAGAAFSLKYQESKDEIAICFLGDGATAQGAFHETLNMAALWELPLLVVIENNIYGMGTHVKRALAAKKLAEDFAKPYGLKGYTVDGTDYLACYKCFKEAKEEILKTGKPVLIEAIAERFKGHSISDPGLYRTKDHLKKAIKEGPILKLFSYLKEKKWLSDKELARFEEEARGEMIEAVEFAKNEKDPDPATLEEGVFAP